MKKVLFAMVVFSQMSFVNPNISVSNNYSVNSYVVIDGYSTEILEGRDYHSKRSVASISKVMTAILAIESEKSFYVYTVSENVVDVEGSSVYLQVGEQYRLIDLVYGLLLRSGNDASYAISECVSGNTKRFVELMNKKAKEIGMKNSFFCNPCGLDIYDEGNISTSYDMALLMRYCMNNSLFCEIIKTKEYRFGNKVYYNKNKLLKSYEYLIGGKTGFTSKARRTLVTAGKKNEQYLIIVTLDCGSDYEFHKSIYESYFNRYNYIVFLKKGINYIDEYVLESSGVIGMRLMNDIALKGIKKYFINPYTKKLSISFIDRNGKEYFGGNYGDVRLRV